MKKLLFTYCLLLITYHLTAQNNWKLSIQTWTFHKYSLLETIDKADSLGVKYLEAFPGQQVGKGYAGAFSYTLTTDERNRLKGYLKQKGVKVLAMGVIDKGFYTAGNLEKFFEFANYMGMSFITAEPEWKDLDEFNRLAKKYKVQVALHCHPKPESHYWDPDSMVNAMKGRKFIGAWPDIGHWARSGVDIQHGLKKVKHKLWGLHFKDVQEFNNVNTEDTLFGKGICDLPAVSRLLKKIHFKGVLTMEYEVYDDNMPGMGHNKNYTEEQFMR
jgi:sugar phosphate isomerase/epimerase